MNEHTNEQAFLRLITRIRALEIFNERYVKGVLEPTTTPGVGKVPLSNADGDLNDWIDLVALVASIEHNATLGKQGGVAGEYYHLTAAKHGYIDQDVTNGAAPILLGTNFTGIPNAGLLDNAVFGAKIQNLAITEAKINAGAVTSTKIGNDAVTYAKMQNVSATDKVLGRAAAGAGVVEEIPCTAAGRALIDDADTAAQRTTLGLVIGTDILAEQTIGIADNNLVEIDDAAAVDNDYAKFTANGLEGRSYAEVIADIGAPKRATMWADEGIVTAGNIIYTNVIGDQLYNYYTLQHPAADGDTFTLSCYLAAGTYTLTVLGIQATDAGKQDIYIDATKVVSAQDWYGAYTYNVKKATGAIAIAAGGYHKITSTVNGKNASSSGYRMYMTKIWLRQSAD